MHKAGMGNAREWHGQYRSQVWTMYKHLHISFTSDARWGAKGVRWLQQLATEQLATEQLVAAAAIGNSNIY
jgi:hypothetical protein